jgi:hypothetical protein
MNNMTALVWMVHTVNYVAATSVCSDTTYHGPIHITRTVKFLSWDIQTFIALFEQQHLALNTIMCTVLFKHHTAYLNVTWVFLQYECVWMRSTLLCSLMALIVFVKDSWKGRKLTSWACWEECTVFGDCTVCSCGYSKRSAWFSSMYCVWRLYCVHL